MTMDFSGRRELSAEQVERYRVEGHALIPGLASADELAPFAPAIAAAARRTSARSSAKLKERSGVTSAG